MATSGSRLEHVSELTVDAAHGLPVVQVNVDLRVAQGTTTTVTGNLQKWNSFLELLQRIHFTHNTLVDHYRGHLGDQVNSPLIIDLLFESSDREPHVSGVTLVPLLSGMGGLRKSVY